MSFLNKIKAWGRKPDEGSLGDTLAADTMDAVAFAAAPKGGSGRAATFAEASRADASTLQPTVQLDTSIISEAAPSEMTDFTETRQQDGEAGAAGTGTGIPLIGERPVATQQRILFWMVALGLLGLVLVTILSLNAANNGAAQAGASGQALMQSLSAARRPSPKCARASRCWPAACAA
jgi:twitching motility protein PilJ